MAGIERRRFLAIAAAAGGMALTGGAAPATELWEWRGSALGAQASLRLYHPDRAAARALIHACLAEVERLEAIFSLYREDSALCRLNRDGGLVAPPMELVEVLSVAAAVSRRTQGRFDVTVQPLWQLYADHFSRPGADPAGPDDDAIRRVLPLVDWQGVEIAAQRIALARPGMAVTLNGIAQGYITDRVADVLRRHGAQAVLVNMGEIRALGPKPGGSPWQVALSGGGAERLTRGALATSAADGTRFSASCHHIFDPRTGRSAADVGPVTVRHHHATLADAWSTARAVGWPA
ncbi:MAG TPA: FAD:protein FMN transferase [Magnetospirillum sp.]|nr:FAD:protein FMN transferase [Magnetospirillum sp.]